MKQVYIQTDNYIGRFLHLLDEGWTLILVSDHAQVCSTHDAPNVVGNGILTELGYTVLKKDENGNPLREIDYSKSKAIAGRSMHIYINLKTRRPDGIVDPSEQYELERQIISDLYNYRHPQTGERVIYAAMRNRDALALGFGGPDCGDIIYFREEGYNFDHGDSLATTQGYADTSVSPIFIAAGTGIKPGVTTERIIRQIDVTPTIAVLVLHPVIN